MNTEELAVHQCSQWQAVERLERGRRVSREQLGSRRRERLTSMHASYTRSEYLILPVDCQSGLDARRSKRLLTFRFKGEILC